MSADLLSLAQANRNTQPLAELLRPQSFDDVLGQGHLLEDGAPLAHMIACGQWRPVIFWGSPGCGKTTLARIMAAESGLPMQQVSAVTTGAPALKAMCDAASQKHRDLGQATLLFVDEIHRLNRAQQDVFLPFVESGAVLLVGATTENPSFALNAALLSRCTVLVLKALDVDALRLLLSKVEVHAGRDLPLNDEARTQLLAMADGDARYLLGCCEPLLVLPDDAILDAAALQKLLAHRAPIYDAGQEQHYNLISALHKALRASDADASLYWMNRMLSAGEDANYICRRLLRFASEDIGLADVEATQVALTAWQAFERLGSPEGELAIAQAVVYLATAPKSNSVYAAYKSSLRSAKAHASLPPPMHAVNAPTDLMKDLGYNDGYIYDHDTEAGCSGLSYFPDDMMREGYYQPIERGLERDVAKRHAYYEMIRAKNKRA